jgi:hypothetical protein
MSLSGRPVMIKDEDFETPQLNVDPVSFSSFLMYSRRQIYGLLLIRPKMLNHGNRVKREAIFRMAQYLVVS